MQDVGMAAAAISGYELGSEGRITGDYEDPYVSGWVDDEDDDDEIDGDYDDDDDFITS